MRLTRLRWLLGIPLLPAGTRCAHRGLFGQCHGSRTYGSPWCFAHLPLPRGPRAA